MTSTEGEMMIDFSEYNSKHCSSTRVNSDPNRSQATGAC
jgi:hypothetical protein